MKNRPNRIASTVGIIPSRQFDFRSESIKFLATTDPLHNVQSLSYAWKFILFNFYLTRVTTELDFQGIDARGNSSFSIFILHE